MKLLLSVKVAIHFSMDGDMEQEDLATRTKGASQPAICLPMGNTYVRDVFYFCIMKPSIHRIQVVD